MKNKVKIISATIIILIVISTMFLKNTDFISFLNSNLVLLKSLSYEYPYKSGFYFFFVSLLLLSLSFPVAFILGILAGIILDLIQAIIIVSFSQKAKKPRRLPPRRRPACISFLMQLFFWLVYLALQISQIDTPKSQESLDLLGDLKCLVSEMFFSWRFWRSSRI